CAVGRAGPQACRAVAEIARSGHDHPNEKAETEGAGSERCEELQVGNQALGARVAGYLQRIRSQQLDEGFASVRLPFGKSHQALLKLRKTTLGPAGRSTAVEATQGERQAEAQCEGDRKEENDAAAREAGGRESKSLSDKDQDDSGRQSG